MSRNPLLTCLAGAAVALAALTPAPLLAQEAEPPSDEASPAPGTIYQVLAVDDATATLLVIDCGWDQGLVPGMKFSIERDGEPVAIAWVVRRFARQCQARVEPGSTGTLGAPRSGDVARLLPFVPAEEPLPPRSIYNPFPEATPPSEVDIPDDVAERASTESAGEGSGTPEPEGEPGPRVIADVPIPERIPPNLPRAELHNLALLLLRENGRLHRDVLSLRAENTALDNRNFDLANRLEQADARLEQAGAVLGLPPGAFGQLPEEWVDDDSLPPTLEIGFTGGPWAGDALWNGFPLGRNRPAMAYAFDWVLFPQAPLPDVRIAYDWFDQPSAEPRVRRQTLTVETWLSGRLRIGYSRHVFPAGLRGHTDSAEVVFSLGRPRPVHPEHWRHPVERLLDPAAWPGTLHPLLEVAIDIENGTGTDYRVGLDVGDLLAVWVNYNWSYHTDIARFGAVHARLSMPLFRLASEGGRGSLQVILNGEAVWPLTSGVYATAYHMSLMLRLTI